MGGIQRCYFPASIGNLTGYTVEQIQQRVGEWADEGYLDAGPAGMSDWVGMDEPPEVWDPFAWRPIIGRY